jgi:actin-related protein
VHDGFVLKKGRLAFRSCICCVFYVANVSTGIQKSSLGGNFVSEQLRLQFSKMDPVVSFTPHFMVKSKSPVDAGQAPNATYAKFDVPPTASFKKNEEERIFTSFKESMVQVWQGPGKLDVVDGMGNHINVDTIKSLPPRPFEMPDGWNQVFGIERFRVAEGLFDAKAALTDDSHPAPDQKHTITAMVQAALSAVDVEIRPVLLNNIVLTGGGSLLDKLAERLHSELSALYPNPRVRVNASNIVTDRKYGSWVGGSILASLGTFHQVRVVFVQTAQQGTDRSRCGSPRRSMRSTVLASLRSVANNEIWRTGEKAFLRHTIASQKEVTLVGRGDTRRIEKPSNTKFINKGEHSISIETG